MKCFGWKFFWVMFIGAFAMLTVFPKKIKAMDCIQCLVANNGSMQACLPYCYPSCPYMGWTDTTGSCGSASKDETCCTTGGCSSQCGPIGQWQWCHGICQVMANQLVNGACQYRYRYDYTSCGAQDTCQNTVYLKAGQCSSTGCSVGGIYKVCCSGGAAQTCEGGLYTGTCPGGWQMARMCGYYPYPSCDNPAAVCANPTATPTTGVAATATPTTGAGSPTPTTGALTPTATPTTPAGCTHSCAAGQNSWYTSDQAACLSLPGGVYHSDSEPACTSSPTDHLCCSDQPSGGATVCAVGVAIYSDSHHAADYDGHFNVAVDSATHTPGDIVTITVGQWPAGLGWENGEQGKQCDCKYDTIDVNYYGPGVSGRACTAGSFSDGCAFERSCSWNTSGLPAGSYRVDAYYGGFSPWGICMYDNPAVCATSLTLTAPPPKTCLIESVSQPTTGSVTVKYSGVGNTNPGTEVVRLWLEKTNGSVFNPVPGGSEGIYPAAPTPGVVNSIRGGTCDSTNGLTCSKIKTLTDLKRGDYYVHCDLPASYPLTRCSGNPVCTFNGGSTTCGTVGDPWVSCSTNDFASFTVPNSVPTVGSLIVKNNIGTVVAPESGSRNQICQTQFNNSRTVRFEASVSDADGWADISGAKLKWKGIEYTMAKGTGSGIGGTMWVEVTFDGGDNSTGVFPLLVDVTDIVGAMGSSSTRNFKVWSCQVPVTGNMYDSSDQAFGAVCSTGVGFANLASSEMNFYSVWVHDVIANVMVEKVAATENTYNGVTMIWGKLFLIITNPDINAGSRTTRWIDLGTGSSVGSTGCGQQQTIDNNRVDPYTANPHLQIDFSAAKNQDPWWQVSAGGILSAGSITSMVPPTCQLPCINALSIGSLTTGTNGLVAANGTISSGSGCIDCPKGDPHDWFVEDKNLTNDTINYANLKRDYYDRLGIGVTFSAGNKNWTDVVSGVGASVVFVNGNLMIDDNNSLPVGRFLMVVVNGSVTITSAVTQFDGILVADDAVRIATGIAAQLQINGSVFAGGGLINERSLGSSDENNKTPSVKINYRPDFIFLMPPKLSESIYNWREGN